MKLHPMDEIINLNLICGCELLQDTTRQEHLGAQGPVLMNSGP